MTDFCTQDFRIWILRTFSLCATLHSLQMNPTPLKTFTTWKGTSNSCLTPSLSQPSTSTMYRYSFCCKVSPECVCWKQMKILWCIARYTVHADVVYNLIYCRHTCTSFHRVKILQIDNFHFGYKILHICMQTWKETLDFRMGGGIGFLECLNQLKW